MRQYRGEIVVPDSEREEATERGFLSGAAHCLVESLRATPLTSPYSLFCLQNRAGALARNHNTSVPLSKELYKTWTSIVWKVWWQSPYSPGRHPLEFQNQIWKGHQQACSPTVGTTPTANFRLLQWLPDPDPSLQRPLLQCHLPFTPRFFHSSHAGPLQSHSGLLTLCLLFPMPGMPPLRVSQDSAQCHPHSHLPPILCNVLPPSPSITWPSTVVYRAQLTVRNDLGNYLLGCLVSVSPPRAKATWGQGLSLACSQVYIPSAWNCAWQNLKCLQKWGKWQQRAMRTGCKARQQSVHFHAQWKAFNT